MSLWKTLKAILGWKADPILIVFDYALIGFVVGILYIIDAGSVSHMRNTHFFENIPVLNIPYLLANCFHNDTTRVVILFFSAGALVPTLVFCFMRIIQYLTKRWS